MNAGLRPNHEPARHAMASGTGEEVHALMARLLPICRSITGEGVRETLSIETV